MTYPILRPGRRREERPQTQIMTRKTAAAEHISRRAAN
jgi:hypothetical protein